LVPSSTSTVVVFLLSVAPGTCYELLRGRTQLPREESSFLHVSRILLMGTLITAATVLLLALARWLAPEAIANPTALLHDGLGYVSDHVALVGTTACAQLAISVLIAIGLSDLRSRRLPRVIHQTDAWHAVTELGGQPGCKAGMSVRLNNGMEILGMYSGASTDLDPSKRELLLHAPLSFRSADGTRTTALDAAWQRMTIAGSDIAYIAVAYIEQNSGEATHHITRAARVTNWMVSRSLQWSSAVAAVVTILVLLVILGR
jgi:Family of unknown function (DUF6338)